MKNKELEYIMLHTKSQRNSLRDYLISTDPCAPLIAAFDPNIPATIHYNKLLLNWYIMYTNKKDNKNE